MKKRVCWLDIGGNRFMEIKRSVNNYPMIAYETTDGMKELRSLAIT